MSDPSQPKPVHVLLSRPLWPGYLGSGLFLAGGLCAVFGGWGQDMNLCLLKGSALLMSFGTLIMAYAYTTVVRDHLLIRIDDLERRLQERS